MPLSNNTASRRIDELREDVEKQKLKTRNFSVQLDESTMRDIEAELIVYVSYVDEDHFAEEMLFRKDWQPPLPPRIYKELFKSSRIL